MTRRLIVSLLSLVVVALVVFVVPVGISLANLLRDNTRAVALRETRTVAFLVGRGGSPETVRALRRRLEVDSGAVVEIVDARGRPALGRAVVAPGAADLVEALRGQESTRWTQGSGLGGPVLVVTVPAVAAQGGVVGAVRVTYPTQSVEDQIRGVWLFRLAAGLATVGLTAVLAVLIARWLSRPLVELQRAAMRVGRGDLAVRAPDLGPPETRSVARALNDATARIADLLEVQRRFVADASHQLRSPLTALRLSLDNAQDAVHDPQAREALDRAIAEVVRMTRLTSGLLELARAQAGTTAKEIQRVDEIVSTRAQVWLAAADDRDVALVAEVPGAVLALLGPGNLEQVLDNLVSNALDVTPAGGRIVIAVHEMPAWADRSPGVTVTVTDNGPGMTAEQRARAFDRFWRGRRGGTGLGLAIVHQLVADDHGQVTLRDGHGGRGLRVQIEFPAAPAGG